VGTYTPDGYARKMRGLGSSVPAGLPRATYAAGRYVEASVEALTPDRLRNVGKSGAKVGVRTRPPKKRGADASAAVQATGPFHLLEHPSAAHIIIPKAARRNAGISGRGSRSAKKARLYSYLFGGAGYGAPALRLPNGGLRHSVLHPGVQSPSRPFARGVAIAAPNVSQIYHQMLARELLGWSDDRIAAVQARVGR
jgi:hypothetical protein